MPGLVIDGQAVPVSGLNCVSYLDDPRLRLQIADRPDGQRDGAPRAPGTWIRAIVLHTTKGIPGGKDSRAQQIFDGFGPASDFGARTVGFWSQSGHQAGAHLIVGFEGTVYCTADLRRESTFHVGGAPGVNGFSIGIEIQQGDLAELYRLQLEAVVTLVDFLTRTFTIQRQIPSHYAGQPVERLHHAAADFCGVYGHRDCDPNRGAGDPGDWIFQFLEESGYEAWDLGSLEDITEWTSRQQNLGIHSDGVPGPDTVAALAAAGKPHGLWVARPGD